jgi:hypothetical protein
MTTPYTRHPLQEDEPGDIEAGESALYFKNWVRGIHSGKTDRYKSPELSFYFAVHANSFNI